MTASERFLAGETLTWDEVASILQAYNSLPRFATIKQANLKNGWLVRYWLSKEFDVRSGTPYVRYAEFSSENEAISFVGTIKANKWEGCQLLANNDYYIAESSCDYKGDYCDIKFYTGDEGVNFLAFCANKVVENENV